MQDASNPKSLTFLHRISQTRTILNTVADFLAKASPVSKSKEVSLDGIEVFVKLDQSVLKLSSVKREWFSARVGNYVKLYLKEIGLSPRDTEIAANYIAEISNPMIENIFCAFSPKKNASLDSVDKLQREIAKLLIGTLQSRQIDLDRSTTLPEVTKRRPTAAFETSNIDESAGKLAAQEREEQRIEKLRSILSDPSPPRFLGRDSEIDAITFLKIHWLNKLPTGFRLYRGDLKKLGEDKLAQGVHNRFSYLRRLNAVPKGHPSLDEMLPPDSQIFEDQLAIIDPASAEADYYRRQLRNRSATATHRARAKNAP